MVRWPETPTCPVSTTLRPSTVLPARPTWEQMMLSSPTHAGVADLTRLSIFAPRFHPASPIVATVHRGERLNLDVVFDDRHAGLRDLVVRAVGAVSEAVTVAADHHAVAQHHAIPMRQNSAHTACECA